MSYDSSKIEKKWQKAWKDADLYKCDAYDFSKPKYYVLDMFPYPSAQGLHVGHVEGYTATDAVARYKRACGYNVLHPMGFDSFGFQLNNMLLKLVTIQKDLRMTILQILEDNCKIVAFHMTGVEK